MRVYKSKVSQLLNNVKITNSREVVILYIISVVEPKPLFCIYENGRSVCIVQSPGEYKNIAKEVSDSFVLYTIANRLSKWLNRINKINQIEKKKTIML